jgi:hypothetical protein
MDREPISTPQGSTLLRPIDVFATALLGRRAQASADAQRPSLLTKADPLLAFRVRKPLSQIPGLKDAEGIFVAGEPAIGGEVVPLEGGSLTVSLADSHVRSQRQ